MSLDPKNLLLLALAVFGVLYVIALVRGIARAKQDAARDGESTAPGAGSTATGFVTNFLDTLGIGSFATSTSIFRQWKMVRDEHIPGTLNVGHTLPTIAQAIIYTTIVKVDTTTLILMIAAAVVGAWLGAGVVSRWPRRRIQTSMGFLLIVAAGLLAAKAFGLLPGGDTGDLALTGTKLVLGLAGNFLLGALMTLGIGLYAPCMILIALLGMNPTAAFPIMMGSCAFLMPIASARFIREKSYHPGVSLGLALGGIPAVLIAAFIVKSLPLQYVYYLVVVVVIYTGVNLLRTAARERAAAAAGGRVGEPGAVTP